ncbi:MAG: biotin/lipoyl-binding protein, partial [Pseudomonadota bacterium]
MNYETKITSEAADSIPADLTEVGSGRPKVSMRMAIIGFLILGLLLAIGAYFALASGGGTEAADDNSQAPVVSVVAPGQTTVEGRINAPGTLAARREMPVGVVGEGGRVVSVPVDAGDWVRQGQVLAVIDRSVQTQQAQAQSAQIAVAQSDAD